LIYLNLNRIERLVATTDHLLKLLELRRDIILDSVDDLARLYLTIGNALLERGQPTYGSLAFEVATLSSRDASLTLKKIGELCFQRGDYANSIKYLEKALASDPVDWSSLQLLGDCYTRMGAREAATICYEKAGALTP
jgi:tetratricopeptide (TPR) repeat protein